MEENEEGKALSREKGQPYPEALREMAVWMRRSDLKLMAHAAILEGAAARLAYVESELQEARDSVRTLEAEIQERNDYD